MGPVEQMGWCGSDGFAAGAGDDDGGDVADGAVADGAAVGDAAAVVVGGMGYGVIVDCSASDRHLA